MGRAVLAVAPLVFVVGGSVFADVALSAAAETAPEGRIVGRVLDRDTRKPLAAEIGVSARVEGALRLRHTQASKEGEFVIAGLPAGALHLATKLDGYAAEHESLSLAGGETRSVEFLLSKVQLLRGVVRGPEGNLVAGAMLRVSYEREPPKQGEVRTTYQWEAGDTYSDEAGRFVIGVHPDRGFVLTASHPGFAGYLSTPTRATRDGKQALMEIVLAGGVSVQGTVADEEGRVVPGARVALIEAERDERSSRFASPAVLEQRMRFAVTGPDGRFRFDHVSPTNRALVFTHPGYKPVRQPVHLALPPAAACSLAQPSSAASASGLKVVLARK